MWIEVTDEERDTLLAILEECLSELREGLVKAESVEFKEQLRARKAVVKGLIARLETAPQARAA